MRHRFGIGLAGVLSLLALALAATPALGARWEVEKKGVWEVPSASKGVKVQIGGEFEVLNTKLRGGFGVVCGAAGEGTVYPYESQVHSLTVNSCAPGKSQSSCRSWRTFEGIGLPWKAKLYGGSSEARQVFSGSSFIGVKFECEILGGTEWEECSSATSMHMTNNGSGYVEAAFDSKSAKTECIYGGKEKDGEWKDTLTVKLTSAEKEAGLEGVRVNTAAHGEPEWLLSGAYVPEPLETSWSGGKLTFSDTKATGGQSKIECTDSGEGKALLNEGEITKWTGSSCVRVEGGCKKGEVESLTAVNLPWHEELVEVEGKVRVKLSSTKGATGFVVECNTLLGKVKDECTGTIDLNTENVSEGVNAPLYLPEKLKCTQGGSAAGVVEGSRTIKATKGGKLEVT
jgi:hypothetical protein